MKKIGFVTSASTSEFAPDDRVVVEAAHKRGIQIDGLVWDKTDAKRAASYDLCVIRSTWDYYQKFPDFQKWISSLEDNQVRILNSIPILRWNLSKNYLFEFQKAGIPIIPTWLVTEANLLEILELLKSTTTAQVVIKPTISATSYLTFLLPLENLDLIREKMSIIGQRCSVLLQPFCRSISEPGEYSLMFFNSPLGMELSHTVLKKVKSGDFRVQEEHGGSSMLVEPPQGFESLGRQALKFVQDPWLYARVDIILFEGKPCIGELEMIEPQLFFKLNPSTADCFLDHLESHQNFQPEVRREQ